MKYVCAWCKRPMDGPAATDGDERLVSHGICASCAAKVRGELGRPMREFLDLLEEPVLLVDEDGVVQVANSAARETFAGPLREIEGYRCGDVFECEHAGLPEGCGRTIHCNGCAIRRAVTGTYSTGLPQTAVPATLDLSDGSPVSYLISTEKIGEHIMLRVSPLDEANEPE